MLNLQLPPAVMQDISCTHSAGMCNDLDAQVMQYGSQSANMGNHIYKTIAVDLFSDVSLHW
jgi:calcineurin-like phosphoesterase